VECSGATSTGETDERSWRFVARAARGTPPEEAATAADAELFARANEELSLRTGALGTDVNILTYSSLKMIRTRNLLQSQSRSRSRSR
jgi:hypothetical protein